MNKSLEERFITFAKSLDAAECIDDLPLTAEQKAGKRGDFFFNGRTIVGEIKSLKTNTQDKINALLQPYEGTPEWPLFYGEQEVHKIVSFLTNRDELNSKIFNTITDSIEGIIEKANRQIRETKRTFDLPSAGGLPDPNDIESFVGLLGRKWSAYDGKPFLKTTADYFKGQEFKKFSDDAKKQAPMPRHEVWRLKYRENPHLRAL